MIFDISNPFHRWIVSFFVTESVTFALNFHEILLSDKKMVLLVSFSRTVPFGLSFFIPFIDAADLASSVCSVRATDLTQAAS